MFAKGTLVLLVLSCQCLAEPVIYVFGKKNKSGLIERSGHSRSMSPRDSDVEHLDSWLSKQPSLLVDRKTSDPVPLMQSTRIRGHEASSSSVFLENIKLFDPLYGMQSAPAIDLEALGSVNIDYGTSPPNLQEVTTTGAISYYLNPLKNDSVRTQLSYSSLHQQMLSILGRKRYEKTSLQLYGRQYKTPGRYSYYNNRGTPSNKDDDEYAIRKNNDQDSNVLMPHFKTETETVKWTYFSLLQKNKNGIPSVGGLTDSVARSQMNTSIHYLAAELKEMKGLPEVYYFTRSDDLQTKDPSREFITQADESRRLSESRGAGVKLLLQFSNNQTFFNIEKVESLSTHTEFQTSKLSRSILKLYSGANIRLPADLLLELKGSQVEIEDSVASENQNILNRNHSLSLSKEYDQSRTWLQYGKKLRAPALVEKFGDGRYILENYFLNSETYDHYEWGHSYHDSFLQTVFSVFYDQVRDHIVYLPTLPNRVKAQNTSAHSIAGLETFVGWQNKKMALDLSYNSFQTKQAYGRVPLIPNHILQIHISYTRGSSSYQLHSKFKDAFIRDQRGDLESPYQWVTDLNYTKKWFLENGGFWALQASLLNAFNFTHSEVGGREYAYADLYGHPLPGRYYELALKTGF